MFKNLVDQILSQTFPWPLCVEQSMNGSFLSDESNNASPELVKSLTQPFGNAETCHWSHQTYVTRLHICRTHLIPVSFGLCERGYLKRTPSQGHLITEMYGYIGVICNLFATNSLYFFMVRKIPSNEAATPQLYKLLSFSSFLSTPNPYRPFRVVQRDEGLGLLLDDELWCDYLQNQTDEKKKFLRSPYQPHGVY